MRISACLLALLLVAEAAAQESSPLWSKVHAELLKFMPPPQPGDRTMEPPDGRAPGDSPATDRQTLWQSAIRLTTADEPDAAPSADANSTPHSQDECLDPSKFQPGQVGYLDYYLFQVIDTSRHEVYLRGEHSPEPFCLTNVATDDLDTETTADTGAEAVDSERASAAVPQKTPAVVIMGNVLVRGTKKYKAPTGEKLTVRVVKLLSPEESELVDAERALQKADHPVRTWTSKDGKHKIEARFSKFAGGKVHLVNKAGKNVSISPNNLSAEDRQYYRDLVKKARDAARKADDDDAADQEQL